MCTLTVTRKEAVRWRCIVAMATAFSENGLNANDAPIDFESQMRHMERLNKGGVDAIAAVVTTSEGATMSHVEHISTGAQIVNIQRQISAKVPVIIGAGSNCTSEMLELTLGAKEAKADAVLSGMPYYNKPTPAGQAKHYSLQAETGMPMILYSVSSRTGRIIDLDVVVELANAFPNILGIKDAESPARFAQIRERVPKDFVIWSGNDDQTYAAMKAGYCDGVVSVTANVVPELVKQMVAVDSPHFNWEDAEQINRDLAKLTELMFCQTNPIPVKHALEMLHVFKKAAFRLPLVPMTDSGKLNDIRQELRKIYGIIPDAA